MNKNIYTALLALLILDVVSDIVFLNSLLYSSEQEEDTDKHPLIGKRYIVTDNSYAIDKETGVEVSGLHEKEYVIVSDPYMDEVEFRWSGEKHKYIFVDVFSLRSARKYRVLFNERGVIED